MTELRARALTSVACLVALGALVFGCPRPGPAPNRPDASDAASAPPPPDCANACAHVENVLGCKTNGSCAANCARIIRPAFRGCIAVAKDCAAVDRCGAP